MNNWEGKFGPLLIAEIGGNHEGNFEYAKQLCKLAIESNSDYVKFQIYSGDGLVSAVESPDRNKHFKKFELTIDQHKHLAEMVLNADLKYVASVWDIESLDWIDPYMTFYKIGSGDLTAYPVIAEIAKRKKPIIISTGLSTEKEVIDTVAFIQKQDPMYCNPENLGILQCTSMYPIEYSDANLNVMARFKELTGLAVGYSDHTTDSKALQYAYAMGAEILEFHFTDTREGKDFRDHKVSLTKEDVWDLQKEFQIILALKGSPEKRPLPIEINNNHLETFRRGVYANEKIAAGTTIQSHQLTTKRPNVGVDARDFYNLIGKIASEDILPGHRLSQSILS